MTKHERRDQLRSLMMEYDVSTKDVATILERSYQTVANWRSEMGDIQAPPKNELRLLKFELEARKEQQNQSTNEKASATENS